MNTLPSEKEIDAISSRFEFNCKLLGYSQTSKLLTSDQAAEICGFTRKTLEQKRRAEKAQAPLTSS